jgi:hypothetical protein
VKVRAVPLPFAAAKRISRSFDPVGVMPGVVTAVPVPAVDEAADEGRTPFCTATRWATPSALGNCVRAYVLGSEAPACLTNSLPRMLPEAAFTDRSCVHPDGVEMSVNAPVSAYWARTRMSPSAVPVGLLIV